MTILVAPDKFKGSLTAQAFCNAVERGILKSNSSVKIIKLPLADGGDGTLSILKKYLNTKQVNLVSVDALGQSIEAYYLLHENIAYVELAIASGLTHLKKVDRNPLHTHNKGTGILIKDALAKGAQKIILCLGGSATTEAGLSIAADLGYRFLNQQGKAILPTGGNLLDIVSIEKTNDYADIEFEILCDVNNPLYGPQGAAYIFAPQKGANEAAVKLLNNGLQHIAHLIKNKTGKDVNAVAGAGAAGGIAGGLLGLFNTKLLNGFDFIATLAHLEHHLQKSDIVITGEGNMDTSSLQGKVIGKIAQLCKKHQKKLVVIAGNSSLTNLEMKHLLIRSVKTVTAVAKSKQDAMKNAERYVEKMASEIELD